MNVTEPFVLKRDIVLTPCAELREDVRTKLDFEEGDYTLSVRRSRAAVRVIDAGTAALLTLFREPRTIPDAIVEAGRALDQSPAAWFDELLPYLDMLVGTGVLVPADAADEQEVRPHYDNDAAIAGWTVVRCASLVEDTEIYEVRRGSETAALKIARSATRAMQSLFENEIAVLRHLDGSLAPRLIEEGICDERPYAVMEWIAGMEAGIAAAQRRHDRASLIELCASIASAYAELHTRGVLHGDVHARNVIAGADRVALIDFGYGLIGDERRTGRANVIYFQEPEFVASRPPTPAGEQYSLAALLYFLITGSHYLEFRYDAETIARQIATDPPLAFAQRGVPPWPELERILFRALDKDPSRRFASVADMAALLANARHAAVRASLEMPLSKEAHAFLEATLQEFARGGRVFAEGMRNGSVYIGCAGVAAGLLRVAESRGDAALLALAEVWRSRASARIGREDAFLDVERGLTTDVIGDVTPYYTESGIHAVQAIIAAAMGDLPSPRRAIASFVAASRKPCAALDVTLGRSGSLLAASMLLPIGDEPGLRAFGAETMNAIWSELDAAPPIAESPEETFFGIAHGWAGYIYAALRWCAVSGDALPSRLAERLYELAAFRMHSGRGVYWPVKAGQPGIMSGWCNGTAGYVFLFTLAHERFGDELWLQLAEQSAWCTWDEPTSRTHLCCGSAGRAYALLNLYKHTGGREWLGRARQLANHAAAGTDGAFANSLWRGDLGIAALIADLGSPEHGRMPFFE